jgi:3'(2'), 5'-bisphosphate nucleotidase
VTDFDPGSPPEDADDHTFAAWAATVAGDLLVQVRAEGLAGKALKDAGDLASHELLMSLMARYRPDDAVLSEEGPSEGADKSRLTARRVWIIDPVDGTREFSMPGRTDWAVHIALWQRHGAAEPVTFHTDGPDGGITDAVVGLPALGEVYRTDTITAPPPRTEGPIRIATSANRPPPVVWWLRDRLDVRLVGIGSAGAKAMAVVRGDVDAYIHAGGQWEWDSAAPAGVVSAAGLHASRVDGSPLIYNRRDPFLPDLLMCRTELADVLLESIRSAYGNRRRE